MIRKISGLSSVESLPGVFVDIPKREGNQVRYHACMGLLGIYGQNIEEICDRLEQINHTLSTVNDEGENMFIRFDDYATLRNEYYAGLRQFDVK